MLNVLLILLLYVYYEYHYFVYIINIIFLFGIINIIILFLVNFWKSNKQMIMRFYSNYKRKSNFMFNLIISIFLPTSCWHLMTDLTRQVEGRHSNYTFWVSLGCLLLHWSNSFEISFMMLFYWIRSLCCIKFPIETFFL